MHSLENKLQEAENLIQKLRASAQQEQYSVQNNSENIKKLKRKIMLLTKVCVALIGSNSRHLGLLFTTRVRLHYHYTRTFGLFTMDDTQNDTETETDNDNYGFNCNMQSTSHCTETLSLIPLATFSHFTYLTTYIVLGVAQCEHTFNGPHEVFPDQIL